MLMLHTWFIGYFPGERALVSLSAQFAFLLVHTCTFCYDRKKLFLYCLSTLSHMSDSGIPCSKYSECRRLARGLQALRAKLYT